MESMYSNSGSSRNEDSDGEHQYTPRTPRRTPMACTFCRGRKLKCDGRSICANCNRRGLPCTYVPVAAQGQK
ncbi:uncharacterized protein TRAVEDRAFT_29680 [Trametes versicolor FP-101664 SS1]|uniref:uncharacterized protein n=1 Tax=Trametes versicolor (strain FP-101664) TaxID=717944 RepID=UPI0004623FFA|nr:uncharacterized protein TRAVEDRAFT_29680 [Trametes versicolor FP-101664 SS1]EIW57666.1 hypothetical protein TRAVEDRAFT_29680 [Trametes versicolor FP-101664 SS1]